MFPRRHSLRLLIVRWPLLLALWLPALLPAADSASWFVRAWQTDEGPPDNDVTGIIQTPEGYLWVATQGGLALFDGVRFREVELPTPSQHTNVAKVFFCPAFALYTPPGAVETTGERTCYGVYSPSYTTNLNFRPFGYAPGQSTPQEKPHKITEVSAQAPLTDVWVVTDLDQWGCPNVGWASEIPPKPVHGATRNYLYFDQHVSNKKAGPTGTY